MDDDKVTLTHRWSGWPGAWCLDCGIGDPYEAALADGGVTFTVNGFDITPKWRAAHPQAFEPCPEPGSRRHDPYARTNEPRKN